MSSTKGRTWTDDEHARFLEAMDLYPHGSWKQRASHVGTRTPRQVMTHAQKIVLKAQRHARGLLKAGRPRRQSPCKPSGKAKNSRRKQHALPITTMTGTAGLYAHMEDTDSLDELYYLLDLVPYPSVGFDGSDASVLLLGAHDRVPGSPMSPGSGAWAFDA